VTGVVSSGRDHVGDLSLDCDTVVVGSGAAGAVVATELALAGEHVIVLEEGPYVPLAEYRRFRPSESMRHIWRDGALTVAIGLGDTPAINVTMGRVIGGSSMLTGGVCFRTPEHILDTWQDERGLTQYSPKSLEPYFEHVERAIHVEEVPVSMRSRSTALFVEGAKKLGYEPKSMRRNTRGCNGCGRCNFGCPEGAKMSVDLSYLPRAIDAHAQVWSHCWVSKIRMQGRKAVGVEGRLLNRAGGEKGDPLVVRARRVVVAAGAWHSPLLLMRTGLGGRSGQIGRNMTLHPGFRVIARFDDPVRGWQGALQSVFSDAFEDRGITLTGLFVPPGVLGATTPGVGIEHTDQAQHIDKLAIFGGIVHDEGGGRLFRGPGREPIAFYRMARKDRAAVPELIRIMSETFLAAGAKEIFLPILGARGVDADGLRRMDLRRIPGRSLECSSQHPLGTCRMGVSPHESVVDPDGRVWDVDNLFIADGSIVPTSLGVNPQLSIMAIATRLAWNMRQERPKD